MSSEEGEVLLKNFDFKYNEDDRGPCMWLEYLKGPNLNNIAWVAPVCWFKHAPFSSKFDEFAKEGLVIELPNAMSEGDEPVNWVGTIKCFVAYKALVIYYPVEAKPGEPEPKPVCTWIPFFSGVPKPIGYSVCNDIMMHPLTDYILEPTDLGETIDKMYQSIIFQKPKEPDSVQRNHKEIIRKEIDRCSSRFSLDQIVEAFDKNDCSVFVKAKIVNKVGDRVRVEYIRDEMDAKDTGFWFSQYSMNIHSLGWCKTVGAPLQEVDDQGFDYADVSPSDGLVLPEIPPGLKIQEGMIFEMRHPVFAHKIVPGYAIKVLKHGYFIAGTDWSRKDELVETVLHVTSDYVLPLGFCKKNKIPFRPPKDAVDTSTETFSWKRYLIKSDLKEFDPTPIQKTPNPFRKGHKLEAVIITRPYAIQAATITQVAGRLIKIHFDGYPRKYPNTFQWMSCESGNIYPMGYAEMTGFRSKGRGPDEPKLVDHMELK